MPSKGESSEMSSSDYEHCARMRQPLPTAATMRARRTIINVMKGTEPPAAVLRRRHGARRRCLCQVMHEPSKLTNAVKDGRMALSLNAEQRLLQMDIASAPIRAELKPRSVKG